MASDEKRRDVARALRNNLKYMLSKEGWYGKDLDSNACGNAAYRNIAASVEDCGNLIDGNYIHIVELVADLIDRPTCRICATDHEYEDSVRCDRCLMTFRRPWEPFKYCPNCGAMVVTDDD